MFDFMELVPAAVAAAGGTLLWAGADSRWVGGERPGRALQDLGKTLSLPQKFLNGTRPCGSCMN